MGTKIRSGYEKYTGLKNIQCKVDGCGKVIKTLAKFSQHLKEKHNTTLIDYFVKYENFEKLRCLYCNQEIIQKRDFPRYLTTDFCSNECKQKNRKGKNFNIDTPEKQQQRREKLGWHKCKMCEIMVPARYKYCSMECHKLDDNSNRNIYIRQRIKNDIEQGKGIGNWYLKASEETKKAMAEKISQANTGKKRSKEALAKFSETMKRKITNGEITYKSNSYITGYHSSPKINLKNIFCRCSWEKRYLEVLDKDPQVYYYEKEKLPIPYTRKSGYFGNYYPDYIVYYLDGTVQIVEIKGREEKDAVEIELKKIAAEKYCAERQGYSYVFLTRYNCQPIKEMCNNKSKRITRENWNDPR